MSLGIQNRISTAFGRGQYGEIRSLLNAGTFMLSMAGILLSLLTLPLCLIIKWGRVLKATELNLQAQLPGAIALVVLLFCFGLPLSLKVRLAVGMQLGWIVNVWQAAGSVASLLLIWLASRLGLSFIWFLGAALGPPIIVNIGVGFSVSVMHNLKFPFTIRMPQRSMMIPIVKEGLFYFVPQVSASIMNSAPVIIIAATLGPVAVVAFSLCQRLANSVLQFQALPLTPLWPAYAEAKSRGDNQWIMKTLKTSIIYSLLSGVVLGYLFYVFGQRALEIWRGGRIDMIPPGMLLGFSSWIFIVSFAGSITIFLNGLGELKSQVVGGLMTSACILGLMPFALLRWGPSSAILVMLASWMAFTLVPIIRDVRRLQHSFHGSTR